ncbi:preprotein translocase subunit SecA [Paucilactobacillus oligofermentans DSM 15707 = LMG 22743]|uniref:Protein translocase subunit SecA n=1 Tax=Paucilactobacillus oligofermentans DSM 15707 = LMG 22743 TaxID=1423778 RepID=A0A0R1RHA2_9LACO|nr:accessory Sec system translocase SecA2 [Paucilactobacillus oligofermentans]KRL55742.1 preprotein translocase subunit SecA [Paucilactobacillus oligofermentans DSM 15707 = LMG 22743]CUS27038.1 Protein translocase subunit SecA2 [Paucilactobacillus oligofermentans DSM 15707 = LMG 22743]
MHLFSQKKGYQTIVDKVTALVPEYEAMSDSNLQGQTDVLRQRLATGEKLQSILPDAYAVAVAAASRVLGMKPFENQILGAVAMEYDNVVEMKTGEGKTLTAIMPMYLHGLSGSGNFLVTANEYLANRDAKEMGKFYTWLGLTVMAGVAEEGHDDRERDQEAIYNADIVYTTNSSLGFDYLFDNLAATPEEQFLQGFNFALIDEADAVLLDMAETPLVISGVPRVQSNLYKTSNQLVKMLRADIDYEQSDDTKNVWFTDIGISNMEEFLSVDGLLSDQWKDVYRHLLLSLRANVLMKRNRDYVVDNGEVILLDKANGRQLEGMKMQAGMHQSVEAKENVKISEEQRTMASVTYQNLFRMFHQLAGMTGTAMTDRDEFRETYNLDVYKVPTNKPLIRKDLSDKVFISTRAKLMATLDLVKEAYQIKRPVLIETGSVTLSNLYSRLLLREGIPHNILNARSAAKEARIVAEAGRKGAITVSTSMAGRGTDIRLEDGVTELGGLLVIGTERMENARIDNQLRGRSGRQGDPGQSIFYVSLEDSVVTENAPKWVGRYLTKHQEATKQNITGKFRFKHVIDQAQNAVVNQQRNARFQTLQYGEIFRIQRDNIYDTRNYIMNATQLDQEIDAVVKHVAKKFTDDLGEADYSALVEFIYQRIDQAYLAPEDIESLPFSEYTGYLKALIYDRIKAQRQMFNADDQWVYFERLIMLKAIDVSWIEQVDSLQGLKSVTQNRSLAQRDPVYEYQNEAKASFNEMKEKMYFTMIHYLLQSTFTTKLTGEMDVDFP